jgi:NADPH:quinone reductase
MVDAVIDTTGQVADHIRRVRDGGTVTTVVPPAFPSERGIRSSLTWREPDPDDLAQVAAALANGVLTPRVAMTFPLEQAAQAHARFEQRGLKGKIVLV